jgi:hypothetical protein
MKRTNWFEILLVVVVMSISLYAALSDAQNLSMRWFTRDDAYYYFKVAQNISEGHGSTFDGINPTNGYHPLWLWICIPIFALARFDLVLPLRILLLVMSGLSAATAVLLYRMIGKVFVPAIGAIAAIYWAFNFDVWERIYRQGLETGIAAFTVALLVYKLFDFERTWRHQPPTNKQMAVLGGITVLAMFSRLDLVFLAALAGIWIVFRKYPLRYLLPLDIVFIVVSVLLALIFRVTFDQYSKYSDTAVAMIALSLVIKIPGAYLFGLYQHAVLSAPRKLLKQLVFFAVTTSALVGVAMIAIAPFAHFEGFPRITILTDMGITVILYGLARIGVFGLRTNPTNVETDLSPIKELSASWKTWLKEGFIYYGIVFGALAIYMVANKIAFGTSSPVSGQIKRWWGSLSGQVYGGSVKNELSFFGIDYSGSANAWHPVSTFLGNLAEQFYKLRIVDTYRYLIVLCLFALVFYFLMTINKQKAKSAVVQLCIIPLLAGAWIQVLSYHITGYSAYKEWYWVIQPLINVLVLSLMAGMLYQTVRKYPASQVVVWVAAAGTAFVMVTAFWNAIHHIMPYNETAADVPYNDIAAFLEQNTEPGSIIGMTGGGNAGYFIHDRTVVNMDGLINSYEYFQLLKARKSGEYLAEIGMDYILGNIVILDQLPYKGQYEDYYQWTNQRYGGKELIRYRLPQPEE